VRFRPMKALLVGALAATALPLFGGVAQAAPVFYNGQITTTVSGNTVTASVPISSSENTSVNRFGACVTSTAEKDDFPLAGATTFTAWGVKTQTSARDFAPGTYTITPCVETTPGVWVGTSPQPGVSGTKTFTVTATPGGTNTSPSTPAGLPGYTTKVWAEEFNGTAVNTNEWTVADGATNNLVTSKAGNVRVLNGALETRVMSTGGDAQPETGAHLYTKLQNLDVGEVLQFRAKFRGSLQEPSTVKYRSWTAVWTAGDPWALPGELDVAENVSGDLSANYHYDLYPNQKDENHLKPGFDVRDQWATFAVERTATDYKVYWNGVLVQTIVERDNGGPQKILITAGNGSDDELDWAGSPLQVDYAAVYKKP
jgi:hypothetical protein